RRLQHRQLRRGAAQRAGHHPAGHRQRGDLQRRPPIDVLALQEVQSQATTAQSVVNLLNAMYGASAYARDAFLTTPIGQGRVGVSPLGGLERSRPESGAPTSPRTRSSTPVRRNTTAVR